MEIRKAVRVSMSIPLYFQCVKNDSDDILVDGGVVRNYPIDLFDHERYIENPENGEAVDYNTTPGYLFNHETLGFRLDEFEKKEASMITGNPIPYNIKNVLDYAKALVAYMRNTAMRLHLHKNDWNRTIVIDTTGIGVTEFSISERNVHRLIENGRDGVDKHFEWREGRVEGEKGLDLPQ
jgi:NTE family protein